MDDPIPSEFARRAFGCGLGFRELKKRFATLEQGTREALERVAWRMWVTLTLRYRTDLTLTAPPLESEDRRLRAELKSLEVYLLVTCLDTIANRRFKHFKHWLNMRPNDSMYSRDDVANLYEEWRKEYGPTQNLRALFHEVLPDAIFEWVAENIRIYARGTEFVESEPWGLPKNTTSELRRLLFAYFVNLRRVPYTHRSEPLPTTTTRDVALEPENSLSYGAGSLFQFPDKPQEYWIAFRMGRDEATVLRMVVIAACLKVLGVEVTQDLIKAHVENLSRIHGFHELLLELDNNSRQVELWGAAKDRGSDIVWFSIFRGIPSLTLDRTMRVLERLWSNPLESGLRERLENYERVVTVLDERIDAFNQANPPREDWDTGEQLEERAKAIVERLHDLAASEEGQLVVEIATSTLPRHVGLILRDPCYT